MLRTAPRGRRGRILPLLAVVPCLCLIFAATASAKSCLGKRATIVSGKSTIVGTKAPDVIVVTGGGKHTVKGEGGNDKICGGPGEDTIDGGKGVDSIDGGGGNDTIDGGKGPDRVAGGAGDDTLDGEQGSDTVDGGAGNDKIIGDKGNDKLSGGSGNDTVDGGPGDDKAVNGGGGTDVVFGGAGTDNVNGGPGDGDIVRGDAGSDTLDGGPGVQDIVSYESASRGGVTVELAAHSAKGDGHDSLTGFEDVVGSPQNDTITGDNGANRLDGGVGDDTLDGGGGSGDEAFGGSGSDTCRNFTVVNSCGPERAPPPGIASAILNKGLAGSSLVVQGSQGPDQLRISHSGESWVVADSGPVFPGEGCVGAGGAASCPDGALALIVVTGGEGNDNIAIDESVPASTQVRANGNGGSDTISGGKGDDVLEAGENYNAPDSGNDTLIGNGGSDVLYADPGADVLEGGPGNDLLVSSVPTCQGHTFQGGPGVDTASYARSNAALTVAIGGLGTTKGCATPDHIGGDIESLEGSEGPDVLIGDKGANSFFGHNGADTFIGKGGNDFIDAIDGHRDKKISCGPGKDEVARDPVDPRGSSC